jgi:transcription antitermination factor NusA-like protein
MITSTIDMRDMRYLNIFQQVTRVPTTHTFEYNNTLFFCVPKQIMSKAIGPNAKNIREINSRIRKRIRIIPVPKSTDQVKTFIQKIVDPIEFKDLEIKDNQVILTAGRESKAALIGRNKRRLLEMQQIIKDFFGKEFRIA